MPRYSRMVPMAEIASEVNERTENIGARRLHTVLERLLESVAFEASDRLAPRVAPTGASTRRRPAVTKPLQSRWTSACVTQPAGPPAHIPW